MKITEKQQTVTLGTDVQCYSCGWKGMLGEAKQSIVLDHRPGHFIPSEMGGSGKNYRCPHCKTLIFYVRYDNNRKIIAPSGHQFKDVV
jgi:hypothetical protein